MSQETLKFVGQVEKLRGLLRKLEDLATSVECPEVADKARAAWHKTATRLEDEGVYLRATNMTSPRCTELSDWYVRVLTTA